MVAHRAARGAPLPAATRTASRLPVLAALALATAATVGGPALTAAASPRLQARTAHNGGRGEGIARLHAAVAPANDDFAGATPIDWSGSTGAATLSGTTAGATSEVGEPHGSGGEETVWYSWQPPDPGLAYVVPVSDPPSTAVHVYTGASLAGLSEVGLSSAQVEGAGASSPDESVIPALASTTYYVQVVDPAGGGGPFTLTLTQPQSGAPANDNFADAASLNESLQRAATDGGSDDPAAVGTTAGATTQAGEPIPGNPGGSWQSVWYGIDLPAAVSPSSPVSVSLTASPLGNLPGGIVLGAWRGTSVSGLSSIAVGANGTLTIPSGTSGSIEVSVDTRQPTYFALALSETGVATPNASPPLVACHPPSGWTSSPDVACTATDFGSGLEHPADASFELVAGVPEGLAVADARTNARQVCDRSGNCATAGPYTIEVDRSSPAVFCPAVPRGWVASNVSITCTASDTGSGIADPTDTSFVLSTSVPAGSEESAAGFSTHPAVCDAVGNCTPVPDPGTARIDRTPPVVHCTSPLTGWLAAQGSVTCTAHDSGSGLADAGEASFALTTSVAPATADAHAATGALRVCDAVGNCTSAGPAGPFEVDLTRPVVHCTLPPAWTKGTSVSIPCTARDGGSGLASGTPAAFDLLATGKAGSDEVATSTSRRVCSLAGGCTVAGPFDSIGLADAPPHITCSSVPTTWQGRAVRIDCSAVADGPGLSDPADAHFSLVASVPSGSENAAVAFGSTTVCDSVGNCASTPVLPTVSIDERPPVVSCAPVPSGVQHEEVVVTCTAVDHGSGLADPADAGFELATSVGAGRADAGADTSSRQVCDAVGNCSTAGPFTADVDLRGAPSAAPPRVASPGTVLVLAAMRVRAGQVPLVPVPFDVPASVGGVGDVHTACSPGPASLFRLGMTLVTCGATDQADQSSEASFWVSVADAAQLAASGAAGQGAPWRVLGADFAPGSAVRVELGGAVLATSKADASGRVEHLVDIPMSTPIGDQTLVVRGTSAGGDPLLVVSPIVVDVAPHHRASDVVPRGAPARTTAAIALPPKGPAPPPAHVIPVDGRPIGHGGAGLALGATGSGATAATGGSQGASGAGSPVSTAPIRQPTAPSGHSGGGSSHPGVHRHRASTGSSTGTTPPATSPTTSPTAPTATSPPASSAAASTTPGAGSGSPTPGRHRSGGSPAPSTTQPSSVSPTTGATAAPPTTAAPAGGSTGKSGKSRGVAAGPPPGRPATAAATSDLGVVLGGSFGAAVVLGALVLLLVLRSRRRAGPGAGPDPGGGAFPPGGER